MLPYLVSIRKRSEDSAVLLQAENNKARPNIYVKYFTFMMFLKTQIYNFYTA
jgi:hypothetical protein